MARRINMRRLRNAIRKGNPIPPKGCTHGPRVTDPGRRNTLNWCGTCRDWFDEYTPAEHAKALEKLAADATAHATTIADVLRIAEDSILAALPHADRIRDILLPNLAVIRKAREEVALAESMRNVEPAPKGRESRFIDAFEIDATALQWEPMNPDDEDAMHGTCQLAGVGFHVMAIHVKHDDDGQLVGIRDPYDRVEDINHLDDCAFQTVEIPGYEGEWLVVIHPFGT